MTRINIIDPEELTDQHLIAEYREIFMIGPALQRSLKSKNGVTGIPENFTLNKGHVKFFYDKGLYLSERYSQLILEMQKRGMKNDPQRIFPKEHFPDEYFNDWLPTEDDRNIVRERIALRISQRPGWYKKYGKLYDGEQ